ARAATGRTRPARVGAVRERVTRVGAAERTRRLARFRPAAERITAVAGERVAALAGERVDALAGERVGGVAVERVDLAEGVAALAAERVVEGVVVRGAAEGAGSGRLGG